MVRSCCTGHTFWRPAVSKLKNGWITGTPSSKESKGTHWVSIQILDTRYPPNPRDQNLLKEAEQKFIEQFGGRIIDGPWYATTTEGDILLDNGRFLRPSHIYYAIMDVH